MNTPRRLAAIVSVDVVGYSARTEADEAQATGEVARLREFVASIAAQHGGRMFSAAGDGFMLEFSSSSTAVEAILRIVSECKPTVRVGAHLGDVLIQANGDLLGHGVNVAARLTAQAPAGGAVISSDLHRMIRGDASRRFAPRGVVRLEKMSEALEVFELVNVESPPTVSRAVPQFLSATLRAIPRLRAGKSWRLAAAAGVGAALVALMLALSSGRLGPPDASLAVLPLTNLSANGDDSHFADGVSEEILNTLARVPGLHVAGRTSSFALRGQGVGPRAVGRRLGVAHVLEGSIRRDGNRIRVTVQLVRAANGMNVWSQVYDRELSDMLAVQQDIATAIAHELRLAIGDRVFSGAAETANPAAYEAYLRGRSLFWTRSSVAEAAAQFERAVELDPQFAAAWAALADVYIAIPSWLDEYEGARPDVAVFQRRAERAARRALELNPNIAASYHALSVVHRDQWQWAEAEAAIEQALELEPRSSYLWEDRQELMENLGRWEESLDAIQQAVEIDPLNPFYHAILGIAHWHLRDYDAAAAAMRRALEINPSLQGFQVDYVALLVDAGKVDDALVYLEACARCDARAVTLMRRAIEHAAAPSGSFVYGDALRGTFGDYVFRGLVGGDELVLARLEEATAAGELVPLAINNRAVAGIRHTARYEALVRATGLDDYWRAHGWPDFCEPVGDHQFRCRGD